MGQRWPPPDELRRLYEQNGLTTRQLGARYGVSHITAQRWLRAAGIAVRPAGRGLHHQGRPTPTADELRRLVHEVHWGYRQIGAHYGVTAPAVAQWLKKYGIPRPTHGETRRKGQPLPTIQELRALYDAGLSLEAVGQRYGVSREPIRQLCRAAGIELRPDGWDGGKRLVGSDGHRVRSVYELRVCEWMTAHGVAHRYEPPLPPKPTLRADFLANGWYIEIWGVTRSASYHERKERKQALYHAHGLPLLELGVDHFHARRADLLERKLRRLL